ncbi:MAG: EamA family transporter RarD [Sphingomonadaceae bacterium]|nr:EamA family transporter RarD [Sphingomonadaceae bacterium]
MSDEERQTRAGFGFGLSAYLFWGVVPLYFKLLDHVGAFEIVAHRIAWALPLLLVLVLFARQLGGLLAALRDPAIMRALALSSVLIAINWTIYIWAVIHEQILAASLGYFLNPLVSVLLGVVVLKERLRRWQLAAITLAGAGVAVLATGALDTLWISITLALSFGTYGLVRKVTPVTAIQGLTIETAVLFAPSLGWIAWVASRGEMGFGADAGTDALLILGAAVTALPMLLFAAAARRLKLSTLGLLQYVAPSLQFAIGAFVFGEPLSAARIACFALIWAGLLLFTADSLRAAQAERKVARSVA